MSNDKVKSNVKVKAKRNIDWRKLVKKWVAKPLAYMTMFALATYGMRQLLATVNETASTAMTVLAIAALVYIIVIED